MKAGEAPRRPRPPAPLMRRLIGWVRCDEEATALGQAALRGKQARGRLVQRNEQDDRKRQPVTNGALGPAPRLESRKAGLQA
jgi:hypothetical protein